MPFLSAVYLACSYRLDLERGAMVSSCGIEHGKEREREKERARQKKKKRVKK
jgi:hypothetical protein